MVVSILVLFITIVSMMNCFKAASAMVLGAMLFSALLIQVSQASVVRPYRSQRSDNVAEEVARRAFEIIKLLRYNQQDWTEVSKRNPGTADTLYNFPMLDKIGRRR
ncbi:hypothetical protein EGW08_004030 [Elysia chlorotica]|uniref:Uncharacterized protein n=1 Tax=Elysia chlorotica TaxID=188477 RepID=A0A433U366_ELYCH|nr:hypothetical protein EGW08_004030 [Elysia chlorotica]